jgi:hypothetical protein
VGVIGCVPRPRGIAWLLLTVDNVNILYVNKQEKWLKYKNMHMSRI